MIPEFDNNGYLPIGVHRATLDEVLTRFGHGSEERDAEAQSLAWLVPICRRADVARLIVNGSFVTNCIAPNDVDCLLLAGQSFEADSDAAFALRAGLPYISLQLVETAEEFDYFVRIIFGSDRGAIPKGMVEIIL